MATKPPSAVNAAPSDSLETIAYSLVEDIPTREMNDRNRLGYCLWIWMSEGKGTIEQAIINSGVRSSIPVEKIAEMVKKKMSEKGISPPRASS